MTTDEALDCLRHAGSPHHYTMVEIVRDELERLRARVLESDVACTALCRNGLDIAAQKENAERQLREYEHTVMTWRNEQHDRLVAKRDALQARVAELEQYVNGARCKHCYHMRLENGALRADLAAARTTIELMRKEAAKW